jgi:hypothetical protein
MSKAEEIESWKKRLTPSLDEKTRQRVLDKIAELESSGGSDDIDVQIDSWKKRLTPSLDERTRQRVMEKIAELESKKGDQKKEPKAKTKKTVKKTAASKEPKVKFVKKKGETKEEEPIPMDIKAAPKKRGRKPSEKKEDTSKEPKVVKKRGRKLKKKETPTTKTRVKKVLKPTVKTAEGEPDCDTLLKQFRERRAKAKASQKKRKTTPVFRKIASDVVDAVEKAIKNVPAKQIKESPKVVIRKFGNLQKAADSFLKAFRDVLGADYQKSQAEVEINELKRLVENLIKKYSKK